MWCSESHLSLISYNEFLKITYPAAAADVGAARGERPKAVSGAAFTLLPLTDQNRRYNSELILPLAGGNGECGGRRMGGVGDKRSTKGEKKKLKRHSERLLPPTPCSQSSRRRGLEREHNDAESRETHCVRGLAAPRRCWSTH